MTPEPKVQSFCRFELLMLQYVFLHDKKLLKDSRVGGHSRLDSLLEVADRLWLHSPPGLQKSL